MLKLINMAKDISREEDFFVHTASIPGRTLRAGESEYLFFSGTAYLGMNSNPEFRQYLEEGMSRYGTNYSSSRNANLQLQVFAEAEDYFAAYTGAEAAITVSSGYLAGQLAIRSFEGCGSFLFAPDTHPALWLHSGNFFTGDFSAWIEDLPETIEKIQDKNLVIVCNSLDPLKAVKYNFAWVDSLPSDKHITLIVDDSHGMGITGREGAGIFGEINTRDNIRLVVVSSLGKALGIPGGIILSDKGTKDRLRRSPYFSASSPIIPAYLYAFLRSGHLYREARSALAENTRQLAQAIEHLDLFRFFFGYPVFYTPSNTLYEHLKKEHILISSFAYPSPDDETITRVVLNSNHLPEDIERLVRSIYQYMSL